MNKDISYEKAISDLKTQIETLSKIIRVQNQTINRIIDEYVKTK